MGLIVLFLITIGLTAFYIPLSFTAKLKRIKSYSIYGYGFKIQKVLKRGIYKDVFIAEHKYKLYKIETFICFGYTDIKIIDK